MSLEALPTPLSKKQKNWKLLPSLYPKPNPKQKLKPKNALEFHLSKTMYMP
jgi:hypothetical protein